MSAEKGAEDTIDHVRSHASNALIQGGPVIVFSVARMAWNLHPVLLAEGQRLRFRPVFGRGLQQHGLEHFQPGLSLS